jgi:hypothetical protein
MTTSLRKILLTLPLLAVFALAASPAQAQLGFAAGYGLNMPNDPGFIENDSLNLGSSSFESSGGLNVGLFYDFPLGPVTLRPGVFLRRSSFDWTLLNEEGEEIEFSPFSSTIQVAEVPIDVIFEFPMASVSPYVALGPSFNFVQTDQHDLRLAFNDPKGSVRFLALNAGAGVQFRPPGLGIVLSPEIRYGHALSGFLLEEYTIRGIPVQAEGRQSMNNLTFRLGISFASIM